MKNFFVDPEDFNYHCSAWVATAIVGSAAVGGIAKAYAANQAAGIQGQGAQAASAQQIAAAQNAIGVLDSYHNLAQGNFDIYQGMGAIGANQLNQRLQELTTPIGIPQEMMDLRNPLSIDQASLEKLPGYQFALQQGLKSTQNSAAARGLGVSGAALKGAATFSKGLADSTFTNYFNQEQLNRQNAFGRYDTTLGRQIQQQGSAYERLRGLVDLGANVASAKAGVDTRFGTSIAQTAADAGKSVASNTIGAANAQAAATNATGGAISDAANNIGGFMAYKGLYGGGMGGSGSGGGGVSQIPSQAFLNNQWGW